MSANMNIRQLAARLATQTNISKKEAETFLKEYIQTLNDALLADKTVKVRNFGNFKLQAVSPRDSYNLKIGEHIVLPAHYKVGFIPNAALSKAVNEPFAYFESVELADDAPTPLPDSSAPSVKQSPAVKTPKKKLSAWWITLLLLLSTGAAAYYFYVAYLNEQTTPTNEKINMPDLLEEQTIITDTIQEQIETEEDTTHIHTVTAGETLRLIALSEYGNKAFWIYLYEENRALIANPNLLVAGTKLVVPPASKYAIDATDSLSVQRAVERAEDFAARR